MPRLDSFPTSRAWAVSLLFALTLGLLVAGRLIIVPNPSGRSDPHGGFTFLALTSTMAAFVLAVVERPARLLLGALLAGLWAVLLALSLSGVHYRFLWQSGEGEFSMMMIALAAAAAILCTSAALQPAAPGHARDQMPRSPSGRGFRAHAARVLWSSPSRRIFVVLLCLFYALLPAVLAATTDDLGLTASAAFPLALHALVAAVAFVASSAAAEAGTTSAKAGYSALAVVAVLGWVILLLFGLFLIALGEADLN